MSLPLHFLRDWLPFGQRRAGGKTGDELRDWLDGLQRSAPEDVATALVKTMPKLIREQSNLHMRIKLLDALYAETIRIAPELELAVHASALPLSSAARKKALATDNLLKVLASGYSSVIETIEAQRLTGGLRQLLHRALFNAIQILARRQLLAYRAYAPASDSSWRHLHRLFRIARDRGLASKGAGDERIDTHYLAALLFAFADPSRFDRSLIDQLAATCRRFAHKVRIYDPTFDLAAATPKGNSVFLVSPEEGRPRRISDKNSAEDIVGALIIDCGEVIPLVQAEIESKQLLEVPGANKAVASLLPGLMGMWLSAPKRRYSRQQFRPHADLVAGIDDLCRLLAGTAYHRRREDWESAGASTAISEWTVLDESPDGFGIRFVRGEVRRIEVGEIIGLRSREQGKVHVCMVRRVSNLGSARLEFGLQELSPTATPIAIKNLRGQPANAIMLTKLPGHGGISGLIATPGTLRQGSMLPVSSNGARHSLQVGDAIETNRRNEVYAVKIESPEPMPV